MGHFTNDGALYYVVRNREQGDQLQVLEDFLPAAEDALDGVSPHIERLFQVNDTNQDGAVTQDEARPVFLANFETYDADRDGRVRLSEFQRRCVLTKLPGRSKEAHLNSLFAKHKTFDFDFMLPDLDGQQVSLRDYQDKVVVVNYWGTWCPPCRKEMPHFVELYKKYRQRGLEIVGVTYERQEGEAAIQTVRDFLKEHDVNYPCLIGDNDTKRQGPKSNIFPRTLFLDRNGQVRLVMTGYLPLQTLEAVVTRLLEGDLDCRSGEPGP